MMRAVIEDDLVVGSVSGMGAVGPEIPSNLQILPIERLRYMSGQIIDAATIDTFHVDAAGVKHVIAGVNRQPLQCSWDAQIKLSSGTWVLATASDVLAPDIKRECSRRIYAVASQGTQMNMTAARAAGLMSAADVAAYALALQWVHDMRGVCADLIAVADQTYRDDAHWPLVPATVGDLVATY